MAELKDSGARREFASGAVRDIQEGKGRCDLLPIDVVATVKNDRTLANIAMFQRDGKIYHLKDALMECDIYPDIDTLFLEVAKHFEDGCKKYGENNWQKGIDVCCYIDSGVRHYLKYRRGDMDEPHDRAFCWNILCAMWTCIHKHDLNTYAVKDDENGKNKGETEN